jgi:hypothetical protein
VLAGGGGPFFFFFWVRRLSYIPMPKKLLVETLGRPKKEPRLLSCRVWWCLSSSPKMEAAMERTPGDLARDLERERDLDLDLGRRKTEPDLLRRLLEEPWWCLDEWWDLRLMTD